MYEGVSLGANEERDEYKDEEDDDEDGEEDKAAAGGGVAEVDVGGGGDDVNVTMDESSEDKPLLRDAVESTSIYVGGDSSMEESRLRGKASSTKTGNKNRAGVEKRSKTKVKREKQEEEEEEKNHRRGGCPVAVVAGIGVSFVIVCVGTALMLHFLL